MNTLRNISMAVLLTVLGLGSARADSFTDPLDISFLYKLSCTGRSNGYDIKLVGNFELVSIYDLSTPWSSMAGQSRVTKGSFSMFFYSKTQARWMPMIISESATFSYSQEYFVLNGLPSGRIRESFAMSNNSVNPNRLITMRSLAGSSSAVIVQYGPSTSYSMSCAAKGRVQ